MLGVSPDEVEAIAKFESKYDLGFTLLADSDHSVAAEYGVWVEKDMYGKKYWGVQRSTFLIDADGEDCPRVPEGPAQAARRAAARGAGRAV